MDPRSSIFLRLVLLTSLCLQFPFGRAASQSLQWTSPSAQTVYGPGDTIKGEWSSSKPLVSPSVSLCAKGTEGDDSSDEDGDEGEDVCGEAIWPSVESSGDQSYFSLSAPDVSSVTDYYLRLKDDFGNKMKSPVFALSPLKSKDSSEGDGVGAGDDQTSQTDSSSTQDLDSAQEPSTETLNDVTSPIPTHSLPSSKPTKLTSLAPDSPAITDSSGTPGASRSKATGAPGTSMQTSVPAAAVSYIPTGPPMPSTASGSPGSVNLTPAQYATSSRAAVPTAAIAIPLALVGTTLLISLILCFAHRRSLTAQRRRNSALIASQQGPGAPPAAVQAVPSLTSLPSSSTVPGDIEKAISALNGTDAPRSASQHGSVVYVPVSVPQQRTQRRDVRRDRVHTYERSYTPSIASSQYSCRDIRHEYGRTPAQEYASSFPSYLDNHNPRDNEPDDVSTTGSVLSNYLSPSYDESCTSRRDDYPRPVPRSHSRPTAPCVDDTMYSRKDVYEVVNQVLANSSYRGSRR